VAEANNIYCKNAIISTAHDCKKAMPCGMQKIPLKGWRKGG
jgi:hypothetical protein